MKKQKWYDNEKDLANKGWFNDLWWGFFMFFLIIGVRHIEIFGNWKGYFTAIASVIMLGCQYIWQVQKIHYLEKYRKPKQEVKDES